MARCYGYKGMNNKCSGEQSTAQCGSIVHMKTKTNVTDDVQWY
jgi:hypothetical protein